MNLLDLGDKIKIMMIAPLPLIAVFTFIAFILWSIGQLTASLSLRHYLIALGRIIPAILFGATAFLLIDNFTYTLFGFGIQSVHGYGCFLYLAVFIFLVIWGYKICQDMEKSLIRKNRLNQALLTALIVIFVSAVTLASETDFNALKIINLDHSNLNRRDMPNILVITADGLSAGHLPMYGYKRNTTPFIMHYFQGKSLFCENAFPNSANTYGSLAAIFTGKPPTQTRTFYAPDILRGKDAYEHLPAILRQYGYFNVDAGFRQYADPGDMNMLHSFHLANDRPDSTFKSLLPVFLGQHTSFFLNTTCERLTVRLMHALGRKSSGLSPFDTFEKAGTDGIPDDDKRVNQLLSYIEKAKDNPFFAHVHFANTHGGKFYIREQVFSRGQTQTDIFMTDFYDDAILQFDRDVEKLVKTLEARGKMKNTVTIITSDHAEGCSSGSKIPLIIMFPGNAHASRIRVNTQHLDIAPTLLQYLHIPKPHWMSGSSLFNINRDRFYPVFSTQVNPDTVNTDLLKLDISKSKPPFYFLGKITVNICHKAYHLYLNQPVFDQSTVEDHTAPCPEDQMPSDATVKKLIFDHLEQNGYDISVVKPWFI